MSMLGWMEISPSSLRKLARGLQAGAQQGVVDEIGALVFHNAYSEMFFPGTSVLHTRARYLFFVPWAYLSLAKARTKAAQVRSKRASAFDRITALLLESNDRLGTIGGDIYPDRPAQPPDFSYWTALSAYGLLQTPVQRSDLLARWDPRRVVRIGLSSRASEDIAEASLAVFDVPEPPDGFPHALNELDFRLTRREGERLIRGFGARRASVLSVAAAMVAKERRASRSEYAWDDALVRRAAATLNQEAALDRARAAAHLAQLGRAVYAVHVARSKLGDAREPVARDAHDAYLERLEALLESGAVEHAAAFEFVAGEVAGDAAVIALFEHLRNRARIARTRTAIARSLLDEDTAALLCGAEVRRKGRRARLHPFTGRDRRTTFNADSVKVELLHYRWRVARTYLSEIQAGCVREG